MQNIYGITWLQKTQLIPYFYQLIKTVEEMMEEVVEEVEEEIAIEVFLTETDTEDEIISVNPMYLKFMYGRMW